mgnify:CR=1 FL=1
MQFPIRRDHYDRENGNEHFINGIETVLEYAENLPAANVAPVVRCKDCKHYEPEEYEFGCVFAGGLSYVKADDYCSYGERKDYD